MGTPARVGFAAHEEPEDNIIVTGPGSLRSSDVATSLTSDVATTRQVCVSEHRLNESVAAARRQNPVGVGRSLGPRQ